MSVHIRFRQCKPKKIIDLYELTVGDDRLNEITLMWGIRDWYGRTVNGIIDWYELTVRK